VLGGEGKCFQKLDPFGIPSIALGLAIEELWALMVKVENKDLGFEIMAPVTQCPHYSIEFIVIY